MSDFLPKSTGPLEGDYEPAVRRSLSSSISLTEDPPQPIGS